MALTTDHERPVKERARAGWDTQRTEPHTKLCNYLCSQTCDASIGCTTQLFFIGQTPAAIVHTGLAALLICFRALPLKSRSSFLAALLHPRAAARLIRPRQQWRLEHKGALHLHRNASAPTPQRAGLNGHPDRALFYSTRALQNSAQPPTRVCGPVRSKKTALGAFRTPGVVLGTCFVCPLVHVDWGIFCQIATRATGHLGFGVFMWLDLPSFRLFSHTLPFCGVFGDPHSFWACSAFLAKPHKPKRGPTHRFPVSSAVRVCQQRGCCDRCINNFGVLSLVRK
jgi:hypothetical protein